MTNSRLKGKRGELEAVQFLESIGFKAARSQQYNGLGDADIVSPDLPKVHIEVKYGYPVKEFNVGTLALIDACHQAMDECGDKEWCVLWRNQYYKQWRLSFFPDEPSVLATTGSDAEIKVALEWLNR